MIKKSAISLIAYDAHYLIDSIRSYYDYMDEIILGVDEKRISWSRKPFTFDEGKLWAQLKALDTSNKIHIVEDNFHKSLVALDNDNYERNFLKNQCSHDWIFSFDADEVLLNAKSFFYDFLPVVEPYYKKVDLKFSWYLPYKALQINHDEEIQHITSQLESLSEKDKQQAETQITNLKDDFVYLVIANDDNSFFRGDVQGFATSKDKTYNYCRWTDNPRSVMTNLGILHWSFCRKPGEVEQKIQNFGHSDKTPNDPFFNVWQHVDLNNYVNLRNFKSSGFGENQWNKLIIVPKKELIPRLEADASRIL